MLVLCLLAFICKSYAVQSGWFPNLVRPGPTIKYPPDYCQHINESDVWDFVVIGGGYGGAIVARRLAEIKKLRILLLEAGEDPPAVTDFPGNVDSLPDSIKFQYFGQKSDKYCRGMSNGECVYNPAKVLGGGSITNRMLYERGSQSDQDDWANEGCDFWDFDECDPYFMMLENYKVPVDKESSDYHANVGPITISNFPIDQRTLPLAVSLKKAILDLGYNLTNDMAGNKHLGFIESPGMVDENGYRQSTANTYLRNIPDNLKVCKNSYVNKINFFKKRAISVEFVYREMIHKTVKVLKEVIVSAGALGSPQILERSGIGKKEILEKIGIPVVHNLPTVGENFQDHFIVKGVAYQIDLPKDSMPNPYSIGISSTTGWLDTTKRYSVPDIKILPQLYTSQSNYVLPIFKTYEKAALKRPILLMSPILLSQVKKGSVHITSKNPNSNPKIIANQFTDKSEIEALKKAMKSSMEIMEHPLLAKFNPVFVNIPQCESIGDYKSPEVLECLIRYTSDTVYDFAGTCSMGREQDHRAVVSPTLLVIGIDNVRVIDASIMPIIPRSGSAIPTAMVAEKGARMIVSKHW